MRLVVSRLANLALISVLCWPVESFGQERVAREEIEGVLTRSLLEVGAFRACATFAKEDQMVSDLTRLWPLDVADAMDVLRKAGYPEDYTSALAKRLNIENATPRIGDRSALEGFCKTLGDWTTRRAMFFNAIPRVELWRLFKR